jgi:hypothetical protein
MIKKVIAVTIVDEVTGDIFVIDIYGKVHLLTRNA